MNGAAAYSGDGKEYRSGPQKSVYLQTPVWSVQAHRIVRGAEWGTL
jgi:hypothetical protein